MPKLPEPELKRAIRSVLMLSPEPPYPLHGGGAYRIASLLQYFARFANVDLILLSDSGTPALLPPGLVRKQTVIPLPVHKRTAAARYLRNARRAMAGVPPLVDRVSGLESEIVAAIGTQRYDLGIVEHSWAAAYLPVLKKCCRETMLDLHNIESVLHERCAGVSSGVSSMLIAAGHRRFAAASRKIEARLLPGYSTVLVTSEADATQVRRIAPAARAMVYPNSLPWVTVPQPRAGGGAAPMLVFSGNFEYHPNIDAVHWLVNEIWPALRGQYPDLRLRLVGRGDSFIRHLLPSDKNIEVTGPVEDALAEIAAATLVITPLRTGSGTRIKILQAWAAGRPVVATALAAEGLKAADGGNLLLADSGEEFAEAIRTLLCDPVLSSGIARAGRLTFESEYTWETAWKALDAYLQLTFSDGLNRYTG